MPYRPFALQFYGEKGNSAIEVLESDRHQFGWNCLLSHGIVTLSVLEEVDIGGTARALRLGL